LPCSTAQRHALAVDVADLERDHLADAQAGAVGNRQRRLALLVRRRGDQAGDLVTAQDHRQRSRHMHRLHLGHQRAAVERDAEKELQPGDRRVERDRRGAAIDHVQLEAAQVLNGGAVGRALEEDGELAHRAQIASLCLGLELPHAHVVEHALAQRRDAWCR
jgi:hypothetical protein